LTIAIGGANSFGGFIAAEIAGHSTRDEWHRIIPEGRFCSGCDSIILSVTAEGRIGSEV
jgi:hypothetical protein